MPCESLLSDAISSHVFIIYAGTYSTLWIVQIPFCLKNFTRLLLYTRIQRTYSSISPVSAQTSLLPQIVPFSHWTSPSHLNFALFFPIEVIIPWNYIMYLPICPSPCWLHVNILTIETVLFLPYSKPQLCFLEASTQHFLNYLWSKTWHLLGNWELPFQSIEPENINLPYNYKID